MKIGSLVYCTAQGLGYLSKSFYDAGVVTDVLVIRHAHRHSHLEWYPKSDSIPIRPWDEQAARSFCSKMDVMLFFETPFSWSLIEYCRSVRVKTVVMVMHECMPRVLPAKPDLILCPSMLDLQCYPDGVYLPVPVSGVTWRKRERAKVFVHNSGHGGLKGRNGTQEVMESSAHIRSEATITVRSQSTKSLPWDQLYTEGDAFLFPEKFNGLSLPLQEAFASGMLVMAMKRFPNTEYLPVDPLISVKSYERTAISGAYREFDSAVVDPKDIAEMIDSWYDRDISSYSEMGREFNESRQWNVLKPVYMDLLEYL